MTRRKDTKNLSKDLQQQQRMKLQEYSPDTAHFLFIYKRNPNTFYSTTLLASRKYFFMK